MKLISSHAMLELSVAQSYKVLSQQPDGQTETRSSDGPDKQETSSCRSIFWNPFSVVLVFAPLGIASKYLGYNSAIVFFFNFLAIIPLASLIRASVDVLASSGHIIGGLIQATFGKAVEMILCIQAVRLNLIQIVQGNLLGSILSNLLLVLGMAIFAAGVRSSEASFNPAGVAANISCQILASISVALPTMYRNVKGATDEDVLWLSRMCALFLAGTYFLFLIFQLRTHAHLFQPEGADTGEEPKMSPSMATVLMLASTLVCAACSECLVDSIEDVSDNYGLPKAFIGVILLPIVGNAGEHVTSVVAAYKGMMDFALAVTVGSSTQIALFVVPVTVLAGWVMDKPMKLQFRNFDSCCMMLAVFLTSQVLQNGNVNWLHGAMLITTYSLIAIICWFIPEST